MPARDLDQAKSEAVSTTDVAPKPADAEPKKFTADGEKPAVAKGGAAAAATASEQAFDKKPPSGDTSVLDLGMHHPDDYKAMCDQAGRPEKWDDKYRHGHTGAKQLSQPYQSRTEMEWNLKRGNSASDAVKDFLKGPTIADFAAMSVAGDLDELRDDLGDSKFDLLFGSTNEQEDRAIPGGQRLKISSSMYTLPFVDQMKLVAANHDAKGQPAAPVVPVVEKREDKPKAADKEEAPIAAKAPVVEHRGREVM